jgi:hypothetical protein
MIQDASYNISRLEGGRTSALFCLGHQGVQIRMHLPEAHEDETYTQEKTACGGDIRLERGEGVLRV